VQTATFVIFLGNTIKIFSAVLIFGSRSMVALFIVFHILIWGPWGFVRRGEGHQSIPVATVLNPPERSISDEARKDAHIASTGVKLD